MKKILLPFVALFFITYSASAQVLKRLGDRAKQKLEQKAGDKVDRAIDDATDGKSKTETEQGEIKEKKEGNETKQKIESKDQSLKSYSRFDFVPGEKILYAEDFSQDAIGEFPLGWNTTGNGEVVTIDGQEGKWMQLNENTKYEAGLKNNLPENYTIEYDALIEFKDDQRVPAIWTYIYNNTAPQINNTKSSIFFGVLANSGSQTEPDRFGFGSKDANGNYYFSTKYQDGHGISEFNHKSTPVHIAIWVQKERIRAWINQNKIFDMPKGIAPGLQVNKIEFEVDNYGGPKNNYGYYISNLKVAAAPPDTRSKLITEGKWSTTGILFDVNSDKIKPESYGVLKQIAGTLLENPGVKIKIIGHTDSDGDDAKNLDLSKRRAASVKIALATEFRIDASRMETDGMGETKPAVDNKTPEGKAQNRRVEFVKL